MYENFLVLWNSWLLIEVFCVLNDFKKNLQILKDRKYGFVTVKLSVRFTLSLP
jgi:hypothetical protein